MIRVIFILSIFAFMLSSCQSEQSIVSDKKPSNELTLSSENEKIFEDENWKLSQNTNQAWKEINHKNTWNNSKIIKDGDYNFPNISFSYPADWEFECCGDTDAGSYHILYPKGSKLTKDDGQLDFLDLPKTFPSLTLYSIFGKKVITGGSVDHPITVTLDEYLKNQKGSKEVSTKIQGWKIQKIENKTQNTLKYIVLGDDGIVEFQFNNLSLFPKDFEEKFVSQLKKSK